MDRPLVIDLRRLRYHSGAMNQQRFPFFASPITRGFFAAVVLSLISAVAARGDWPEYRGPTGDGHVWPSSGWAKYQGNAKPAAVGLPLHWSETKNIKWKTAIPYKGWATPVITGGQVWLTTATEDGHDFYAICVDEGTGKVRFNEKI